jgi:hypothetical protein
VCVGMKGTGELVPLSNMGLFRRLESLPVEEQGGKRTRFCLGDSFNASQG